MKSILKGGLDFYRQNGFLVVKNVMPHQLIDALIKRTNNLVEEADILKDQIFFKADNQSQRGINFLDTAQSIGYLLEEGAIGPDGKLVTPNKKTALNKIGHAMHDLDPVYEQFSYHNVFASILEELGYQKPTLAQSMFIFKNQKFGTKVDMHADNTYIISRPKLSCVGIWCALEDATIENGCMYAFPGSHKNETDYFLRLLPDRRTTDYFGPKPEYEKKYDVKDAIPLEVPKGSVIALHGDLVHFSGHNHSSESRHAYTMHFVDLAEGNHWSEENWLQRDEQLPLRDYYQRVEQLK